MRTGDTSDVARQKRRAYQARNGWVSSTFSMGQGLTHEMLISLEQLGHSLRIALAFFVIGTGDAWPIRRRPVDMMEQDGCNDSQLVRGYVPKGLQFDPSAWAQLRF